MKNYELIIHPADNGADLRRAAVNGCLDSHTVVGFERDLQTVVDSGANTVILNLENLSYISSAGISALMGLTHRLRKSDGELYLLRPTEKVRRVFRTLGFTTIFRIVEEEAEANIAPKG